MARSVQNVNRISQTITELEKLLMLLKSTETNKISLAQVGKELDMIPQAVNTALNNSFAVYFKNHINTIDNEEMAILIEKIESPSEKVLKRIFNIDASQKVVYPTYDEEVFWNTIKELLPSNYYDIIAKHAGYQCEPMSYENIGKELGLTRVRIRQIDATAIDKLRNSSFITSIFCAKEIEEIKSLTNIKNEKRDEVNKAYVEFTKFNDYMKVIPDVTEVNKYIETKYASILNVDANAAVTEVFNIPIENLNFSTRTYNALTKAGYNTLNDIYNIAAIDLLNIKNLGKSSVKEIIAVIDKESVKHPKWEKLKSDIFKLL